MELEPLEGTPVRFPPGRLEVRLDDRHKIAYKRLYAQYQSILAGLPVLRERDFDGRPVKVTAEQLASLNKAFAAVENPPADGDGRPASAFGGQEASKTRLIKRTQYLS